MVRGALATEVVLPAQQMPRNRDMSQAGMLAWQTSATRLSNNIVNKMAINEGAEMGREAASYRMVQGPKGVPPAVEGRMHRDRPPGMCKARGLHHQVTNLYSLKYDASAART